MTSSTTAVACQNAVCSSKFLFAGTHTACTAFRFFKKFSFFKNLIACRARRREPRAKLLGLPRGKSCAGAAASVWR